MKIETKGIDQLPSGLYRVRVQFKGEKITDTAPTLPEAIALYDALKRYGRSTKVAVSPIASPEDAFIKADALTMRSWGPAWLKKYRKEKDFKSEVGRFERHILSHDIADKPLKDVTRDDVLIWCEELKETIVYDGVENCGERDPDKLSFSSRKHCLDLMRALFNDAMHPLHRYCSFNPALGVKFVKDKAEKLKALVHRDWPMKDHEISEHLESFGILDERWISQAALGTAMRQGEQWDLTIDDVHLGGAHPYIHIRESKSVTGTRDIELFGMGLEAFEHWMEVLGRYAPRNPERLVFPTPVRTRKNGELDKRGGSHQSPGAPPYFEGYRDFPNNKRRPRLWWHLYRHTCATGLLSGLDAYGGVKWSIEAVSSYLGHSGIEVTQMYANFLPSARRSIIDQSQKGWVELRDQEARKKLRLVG